MVETSQHLFQRKKKELFSRMDCLDERTTLLFLLSSLWEALCSSTSVASLAVLGAL